MIYAISDLHGCPADTFLGLLEQVNFSEADTLYILGDVIDRGQQGVELLLAILEMPNAQLLMGNHEKLMLDCGFLLEDPQFQPEKMTSGQVIKLENWLRNGGAPTLRDLLALREHAPHTFQKLMAYIKDLPLYAKIRVNEQEFVLCHSGLGHFHKFRPLATYSSWDLLWERPGPDTVYYPDKTVVFGHTPTVFYDESARGREYRANTWICIDAGAAMGEMPMLLRLDDLEAFYAKASEDNKE